MQTSKERGHDMKRLMKTIIAVAVIACTGMAYGHYHHRPYHHGHYSSWGPGGRYFWPGFTGGLVGSMLWRPLPPPPPPVVVQQPVVVPAPSPVVVQPAPVVIPSRTVIFR